MEFNMNIKTEQMKQSKTSERGWWKTYLILLSGHILFHLPSTKIRKIVSLTLIQL